MEIHRFAHGRILIFEECTTEDEDNQDAYLLMPPMFTTGH